MKLEKYLLQDLLIIKNGKDHKLLDEGSYPVLGSGGVMRYANKYLYDKRSILLPRKGTLSNIQYIDTPFWTVDTLYYTIINEKIAYTYYLYCYLNSLDLSGYDSGASIPSMTQKAYNKIRVNLPNLKIQEKLGLIIRSYDNLIENNNKRIKILEQMAENLYKEWFVRFRFPGYENSKFEKKTPFGWIILDIRHENVPVIFNYESFDKLGHFVRGKNITADEMIDGEIPVISAGLQPSGYHYTSNVDGISLTISASGANAGYLKYNLNDIWAADCSYYQNNENIWFAYNTLKYLQPVISNLQCGAAQPHVYPQRINTLNVLMPTDDFIKKYNEYVSSHYNQIAILQVKNQNLIKQRDLLLPRLMSGKLEVK